MCIYEYYMKAEKYKISQDVWFLLFIEGMQNIVFYFGRIN